MGLQLGKVPSDREMDRLQRCRQTCAVRSDERLAVAGLHRDDIACTDA